MHLRERPKLPDELKWTRQEWGTPEHIVEAARQEYGLGLDVCARRENHKLPRFFDQKQNGLHQVWDANAWCNPPFNDIMPWMCKAYDEVLAGHCDVSCVLAPLSFDTQWAQAALMGEIQPYTNGRVAFVEPLELREWREANGLKPSGPAGGVMLTVFHKDTIKTELTNTTIIKLRDARTGGYLER